MTANEITPEFSNQNYLLINYEVEKDLGSPSCIGLFDHLES